MKDVGSERSIYHAGLLVEEAEPFLPGGSCHKGDSASLDDGLRRCEHKSRRNSKNTSQPRRIVSKSGVYPM